MFVYKTPSNLSLHMELMLAFPTLVATLAYEWAYRTLGVVITSAAAVSTILPTDCYETDTLPPSLFTFPTVLTLTQH